MSSYIKWETFRKRLLADPKVKAEHDRLQPEFAIISAIIEQRAKKGLTQAQLAKRMKTKQSAISRLEGGTYNPSLAFLKKLADALGTKLKISFSRV